jgi:hypothetical protein
MSSQEALRSSRDAQFHIGRPIEPDWAEHFATVLRSILPSQVIFKPRERPGIIYVDHGRLFSPDLPRLGKSADETQAYLQDKLGSMLVSLAVEGELDRQTATDEIMLQLHRQFAVKIKRSKRSYLSVGIGVEDKPVESSAYEELSADYVIEAERNAFTELFAVPDHSPSARAEPIHSAYLGCIFGSTAGLDSETLYGVNEQLKDTVPFLGIDILDTWIV